MKKLLAMTLVAVFALTILAGCSAGGYKDGTYKAEAKEFSHGWKDYATVTIADGKVSGVEYDALNESGAKKSEDPAYRESMEPVSGTYPEKFMPELVKDFMAKGDIEKVDNITGATNSTNSFKALVKACLANAKKGDTATAVIDEVQ